ncbi:MAG: response regulator [Nanoarchaeota archaeon]|nr:response regulator [Nanoarchaeota archaeon]
MIPSSFLNSVVAPLSAAYWLATVYGIIERHNGYIQVDTDTTEKNHGTAFHIYLPAVKRVESKSIEEKVAGNGTGRILVIDDEEMIRDMAQFALEDKGYDVVTASNGETGYDIFRGGGIDLVLTDLVMSPGIGGIEVCNKIRARDGNVPIYAMSGYQKDKKVQEMLDKGANGFLSKPFQLTELYDVVEFALQMKTK